MCRPKVNENRAEAASAGSPRPETRESIRSENLEPWCGGRFSAAGHWPLITEETMRHQKAGRKFKRSPEHRRMLLRNLATALLEHGKIKTTLPKAKEVQPYVEKLITLAKNGWDLNNFRRCLAVLTSKSVAYKLFHEIGPRYKTRPGGYTRIYKLAQVRQGDAAAMAVISLLGEQEQIKAPTRPAIVSSPSSS
jgi:large subunit ribosomal protein L17